MKRFEKFEYLKNKGWKYDPETGKIFNSRGSRSFSKNAHGYVICKITLKDKQFALYGHHFAWYWVHGNVKINQIDHINRNKSDNRISNLRNVTNSQNQWNRICKGYTFNKPLKKYQARIGLNGNQIHLGVYDTPEEAREAYLNAKNKYHVLC